MGETRNFIATKASKFFEFFSLGVGTFARSIEWPHHTANKFQFERP